MNARYFAFGMMIGCIWTKLWMDMAQEQVQVEEPEPPAISTQFSPEHQAELRLNPDGTYSLHPAKEFVESSELIDP